MRWRTRATLTPNSVAVAVAGSCTRTLFAFSGSHSCPLALVRIPQLSFMLIRAISSLRLHYARPTAPAAAAGSSMAVVPAVAVAESCIHTLPLLVPRVSAPSHTAADAAAAIAVAAPWMCFPLVPLPLCMCVLARTRPSSVCDTLSVKSIVSILRLI
jgi:hypothetical protein